MVSMEISESSQLPLHFPMNRQLGYCQQGLRLHLQPRWRLHPSLSIAVLKSVRQSGTELKRQELT